MNWRSIACRLRRGRRDNGQDLLEYAMLTAFIAITVLTVLGTLGNVIKSTFWDVIPNVI
jgi:Flp pilus assembly pilin Flp